MWMLVSSRDTDYWGGSVASTHKYRPTNIISKIILLVVKPFGILSRKVKDFKELRAQRISPYADSNELTSQIISTLEPVLVNFGISEAQKTQKGTDVVWCTASSDLKFKSSENFDSEDFGSPGACADVWIKTDPNQKVLSVDFVDGLFEFMTGTSWTDRGESGSIALGETLSDSLKRLKPDLEKYLASYLVEKS